LALSNTDVQFSLDIVRTRGLQVRCIKDVSGPPIITPSVNKLHAYFGVNITPITFVNFGAPVTLFEEHFYHLIAWCCVLIEYW
jgi:hypothetical protein